MSLILVNFGGMALLKYLKSDKPSLAFLLTTKEIQTVGQFLNIMEEKQRCKPMLRDSMLLKKELLLDSTSCGKNGPTRACWLSSTSDKNLLPSYAC